jgi:hypothetical protein
MNESPSERYAARPLTVWLLVVVLAVLSLGGLVGAWMFLAHPDGVGIGMEKTLVELPVDSFTLPGVFLLVVMGLLPAFLVFGLLVRPDWRWLDPVCRAAHAHWSWVFTVALGIGIAVWLGLQSLYLGFSAPAQYFTALLGIGILVFALVPSTRRAMRQ